jgi:hypothetical protein
MSGMIEAEEEFCSDHDMCQPLSFPTWWNKALLEKYLSTVRVIIHLYETAAFYQVYDAMKWKWKYAKLGKSRS